MHSSPGDAAETRSSAVGGCRIDATLDRGQLASIDLATDTRRAGMPLKVVVKRAVPSLAGHAASEALLTEEAALLRKVEHPNVIALRELGRAGGQSYLILDYVEGGDLRKLLSRDGPRPPLQVLVAIFADALRGLSALHEVVSAGRALQLVHQAPHARHIVLGVDGSTRLIDLTHAHTRTLAGQERKVRQLLPSYSAPEQLLVGSDIDARTDLFVLGISLWESLTERALFAADTVEQARQRIARFEVPAPSAVRPELGDALDAVCLRALSLDRDRRFGSAAEMLGALLAAANGLGAPATRQDVSAWVRAVCEPFAEVTQTRSTSRSLGLMATQLGFAASPPPPPPEGVRETAHEARKEPTRAPASTASRKPTSPPTQKIFLSSLPTASWNPPATMTQWPPSREDGSEPEPAPEQPPSTPARERRAPAREEPYSSVGAGGAKGRAAGSRAAWHEAAPPRVEPAPRTSSEPAPAAREPSATFRHAPSYVRRDSYVALPARRARPARRRGRSHDAHWLALPAALLAILVLGDLLLRARLPWPRSGALREDALAQYVAQPQAESVNTAAAPSVPPPVASPPQPAEAQSEPPAPAQPEPGQAPLPRVPARRPAAPRSPELDGPKPRPAPPTRAAELPPAGEVGPLPSNPY